MTDIFAVRGTEVRHTPGHVGCPACARSQMSIPQVLCAELRFGEAFELWLSARTMPASAHDFRAYSARWLAPKTIRDYRACARALEKFFGVLRLGEIHPGHLREYQRGRASCDVEMGNWTRRCGANRIRKEVALLIAILCDAKLWGAEEARNFRLVRAEEKDVPRAMQPEEQRRFLTVAASREEWQMVYWYAVVALQTTCSTNELRGLRIADILLEQRLLQIRAASAKNRYRIRTIPLESREVMWAISRLIERARSLGADEPQHYLFPMQQARGRYDPNRPMGETGIYKRWRAVRRAAGLDWLRPYDLRHTAITRMAEAGVPIAVIMAFAGHMTRRMQEHYTTVSMMAKRGWARSTWEEPGKFGPDRDDGNHRSTGGVQSILLKSQKIS